MAGMFLGGFPIGGMMRDGEEMLGRSSIQQADAKMVQQQKTELSELRDQVARLSLMSQALWELLRDRLQVTDAELEALAAQIDLRDGKQDNKMTSHALKCPKCGRVSNSRLRKCIYCGLLFEGDLFG